MPSRIDPRFLARTGLIAVASVAGATLLVAMLQDGLGVPNASAVYLVAVVGTAVGSGTAGAVLVAVASILVYDFLFTAPLHTFAISDPDAWLTLGLLLFIALVVGELAGLQRSRAQVAVAREREARELFTVSRALATRRSTMEALPEIAGVLATATGMDSVQIALGPDDASERIVAATGAWIAMAAEAPPAREPGRPTDLGGRPPLAMPHAVLRRAPGDVPATWVRVHPASSGRPGPPRGPSGARSRYRVRIEVGEQALGSIWGEAPAGGGLPDRSAARLLAAAADQLGQALVQDRLALEAREAEVSRESDTLKSALLQSVSHDLRTPLAAIRAAVATLRPDSRVPSPERAKSVEAIEHEVLRLDRLVANLLDLGRIEAGTLRAQPEVFELDDVVGSIVARLRPTLGDREVQLDLPTTPVSADPVFLDEVVTNLLENAGKFAPGAVVRVSAVPLPDIPPDVPPDVPVAAAAGAEHRPPRLRLTVEDGGPGVPEAALQRIFEPFRTASPAADGRRGTGLGLAVVRGLAAAMDAPVDARASSLGGLAVDIELPIATLPPDLATTVPLAGAGT